MDPSTSLINVAIDYGMAGLFLAYMIWQSMRSEKKQDALQDRFLEQIEALRTKSEEDVSELRDRYDAVIKTQNEERTQIRSNIAGKVGKVADQLEKVSQRIDGLMINQETMLGMAKDQLTERKARSAAASMVRQLKGESGGSESDSK